MAILGQYALTLPADTSGNRPSASTAMVRVNTSNKTLEFYNGSQWIQTGFPGSSPQNPASSAVQIFNCGVRGKGFFWLSSPNGGTVLNFCDLDTVDENGVAGWILVAQFPYSSGWRNPGYTTRDTLNPLSLSMNENAQNDAYTRQWSANWGNYTMNRFRVTNTSNINSVGSSAQADWYYHYSTACRWKEVWNYKSGTGNWYCGSDSDNAGNLNAPAHAGLPAPNPNTDPQPCLRGFNWAYNLKFSVQVAQNWSGFTDNSGGTASNGTYSWWEGLTNPGYTLGWNLYDDGSISLLPTGVAPVNYSGQDRGVNNSKFGYDDTAESAMWATSAGQNNGENSVTDGYRRQLYFWIK